MRLIAIGTALAAALAVGVGVSAPAQAETWVPGTTYSVTGANGLAVTPDGSTLVVGSNTQTSVTVFDIASGTSQSVDLGFTTGAIIIDAAGTYAYVASYDASAVYRLTLADMSVWMVEVSTHPRYLAFSPGGAYLYVHGEGADRIDLNNFAAKQLGFFAGAVPGPIGVTGTGEFFVMGNTSVQRFASNGDLLETWSRTNHPVYAAAMAPGDEAIIGVDDNGNAYRTSLSTGLTEFWGGGIGWGAGYGDLLVIGDYAYTTGLLGQLVSKFSLTNINDREQLASFDVAGYPKFIAAPASGNLFYVSLPGVDQVRTFRVPQRPDTPAAPSAVAGDGEATVTASGAGTGSPATSLTVTASPGDATCQINAASGECTVPGLENGIAYTFTVVATNDLGDSDPSPASAAVTPQAAGSGPSASAVRVTGSAIEGSTLTATISDLAGSGTVERVWTWQRKKGNSAWVDIANTRSANYVIKAADIGAVLRARVTLSNDLGEVTVTSNPTAVVLSKAVKPAPPGSVKAAVKAKSAKSWTITVAWAKVSSPVDDPITAYEVTCKAGKVKLTGSVKGTTTSVALVATQQGTYLCTVTDTRRRGGTSNPSTSVKAVVK